MKAIKIHKYKKNKNKNKSSIFPVYLLFPYIKIVFFIILLFTYFSIIKRIKNTNKENKNNVHVSLNIDDKYIYPSIVFLTSLLDNRANSTFYNIHILGNNNLSMISKNKINQLIDKFGNNSVKLNYYNLEGYFKNATVHYVSLSTYFKLHLPSLLPYLDKIIYIDGDVLNFQDLSEMYNITLKKNIYYCGITDYIDHLNELKVFWISTDKYINAGVLLINLKALRENSIEKKIIDFVSTHRLRFEEQTAINTICYNNTQVLPYKYNLFAYPTFDGLSKLNDQQNAKYKVSLAELNQSFNDPTLYHYVSIEKPWQNKTTKFNRVYWWYYAKMSGFYKEILDHYNFNIRNIEDLLKRIPEDGGLLRRNYKKFE